MPPKLYYDLHSAPARAVLLTMEAIGLEMELIEVSLLKMEQLKPEYIAINPQHVIPTLVDDDIVLWDSHAITPYLVCKYAPNLDLYPEEICLRAKVNQRMHFNSSTLFPLLRSVTRDMIVEGLKSVPNKVTFLMKEAYGFLENFLEGAEWLAGHEVTLADIHCICSVSMMDFLVPIDEEEFVNVTAWFRRCQELPYYAHNQAGVDKLDDFYEAIRSLNP